MGVVSGWFGSRLARYLFRTPPVPQRWRRRMLSLGSGDLGSGIRLSQAAMDNTGH